MIQELQATGEMPEKHRLGKRIEELALALFLVMTGALWLAPDAWVPEGTWLACVGLILLGLNAARHLHGLPMSGFGIIAGATALAAGSVRILGFEHLFVPDNDPPDLVGDAAMGLAELAEPVFDIGRGSHDMR